MTRRPTTRISAAANPSRRVLAATALAAALLATVAGCSAAESAEPRPESSPSLSRYEQAIQDTLDEKWASVEFRYPSAERPEVAMERVISGTEWAEVTAQCLQEEGFDITVEADGGISWENIPGAQTEAFEVAQYVCTARYPRNPREQEPLDEKQLGFLYDYYTGEMTECMESFGYTASPAPSRETFIEQYYGHPWSPYRDVFSELAKTPDKLAEFEAACPQTPEGLFD